MPQFLVAARAWEQKQPANCLLSFSAASHEAPRCHAEPHPQPNIKRTTSAGLSWGGGEFKHFRVVFCRTGVGPHSLSSEITS